MLYSASTMATALSLADPMKYSTTKAPREIVSGWRTMDLGTSSILSISTAPAFFCYLHSLTMLLVCSCIQPGLQAMHVANISKELSMAYLAFGF
jgi:hypothetical protein